jgi:hypothetical protein
VKFRQYQNGSPNYFLSNNWWQGNNLCQAIEIYAIQYDNRGLKVVAKIREQGSARMTRQEAIGDGEDMSAESPGSQLLAASMEPSHWSQNHGPTIIAIAMFTLIVGYGVIFFNSATTEDFTRPLVPNNFVPDEDGLNEADPKSAPSTNESPQTAEPNKTPDGSSNPTPS